MQFNEITKIRIEGYEQPYELDGLLKDDTERLNTILANPPKVIMIHTYPPKLTDDGEITLGNWQYWTFRGATELIENIRKQDPNYSPKILVPGGFIGIPGQTGTISNVYASLYERQLPDYIDIIPESKFRGTTTNIRLATDTGGEISFLKAFCERNGIQPDQVLQLGLLPHVRARHLGVINGFNFLGIESVLVTNHRNAIDRFIRMYKPELYNYLNTLKTTEERNFAIMRFLHDEKGLILNILSKILTTISPMLKHISTAHE